MDGPTRESAARSGVTTDRATEMGFNLELLKKRGFEGDIPASFLLPPISDYFTAVFPRSS